MVPTHQKQGDHQPSGAQKQARVNSVTFSFFLQPPAPVAGDKKVKIRAWSPPTTHQLLDRTAVRPGFTDPRGSRPELVRLPNFVVHET